MVRPWYGVTLGWQRGGSGETVWGGRDEWGEGRGQRTEDRGQLAGVRSDGWRVGEFAYWIFRLGFRARGFPFWVLEVE